MSDRPRDPEERMSEETRPTPEDAKAAAQLLGVEVFDLRSALGAEASEMRRLLDAPIHEDPLYHRANALAAAANACEVAHYGHRLTTVEEMKAANT